MKMVDELKFETLGEAFEFLDKEYKEIRQKTDLFFSHIKEITTQLAEQAIKR